MMLKIGITGNIGSGKTTVCKVFQLLGIPVFYADEEAKNIMATDAQLIDGIKSAFGAESYFVNGALNRKYIAGLVFKDEAKLNLLNSLVHPATFRAFDKWASVQSSTIPYVLKEAALLFETDAWKGCTSTVLISSPFEIRAERVMKRSGLTREEVISRESKQLPEELKVERADHVIVNDGSRLLIPQVLELHALFSHSG